jgi:DNA-binding PadR family transcriptional regulator
LGRVWQIGRSQLYAQLKQLEEDGLVIAGIEPQANRPDRKVYNLTDRGRQVFLDWVQSPTPYLRYLRVEFLARLYFFQKLSLPGFHRLVDEQQAVCREQAARFEELAARAEDDYERLVFEFRSGQLEAVVVWLERCLQVTG